ncbi:MAG: hypothetical protein CI947_2140 [Halanaerobium sp.]|nr:MAG: hypothetical protein CI947_2140 [Halanaerobium sp.]
MSDLIPKNVDLAKVKLSPKGFIQLVLALVVVFAAVEIARWLIGKIRNVGRKTGGQLVAV